MKRRSDATEKQSRRAFAKSIAAALITAPLASSAASAEASVATERAPALHGLQPALAPLSLALSHLPPITVRGSSFILEINKQLMSQTSDLSAYNKYAVDVDPLRGDINAVYVSEEYEQLIKDFSWRIRYPNQRSEFWVWFQRWTGGGFDPADLNSPTPHARVRGNPFTIYVDKRYDNGFGDVIETHKSKRPYRYKTDKYKESGGVEMDFRVGKWRMVRSNESRLFEEVIGSGTDSFNFELYFDHSSFTEAFAETSQGEITPNLTRLSAPRAAAAGKRRGRRRR